MPFRASEWSGRPGPQVCVKDGALEGRSLPSPKVGFVEEFSHFCECPRCFDLCYSLLESEVETFLCTQFFRTEDILRDSHPSLSGQIGSFRLWLDWNRFFPALRAFLLAVGTFQTISVGVSPENPLAPLPDWSTLGARRSLQGSLCLFCAKGFKKVVNNLNPFKGNCVFPIF